METNFRFSVGDVCVFTNRGSSGVTKNDGKQVTIINYTGDELARLAGEPCYTVEGLPHACAESELVIVKEEKDDE